MQILVATLRGAVHQQQRAAAYAALLPSLLRGTALQNCWNLPNLHATRRCWSNRVRCAAIITTGEYLRSERMHARSYTNRRAAENKATGHT